MPIGAAWDQLLVTPLVNFMVALAALCFGSFGFAILLFTLIMRGITFPLTLRTLKSMRAMQVLQPKLQEVQKKYSDPKRRSEETMKLYREHKVNPLGCLGPTLIQTPIFIALYGVIRITLASTPEDVLKLSSKLYPVSFIKDAIPLNKTFLTMDLGATNNYIFVALVFCSMWLQQRISSSRTTVTPGSQQAQTQQMMQWFMPAIFAWFVIAVPAGLGLYWFASTTIGIILQWIFVGPGDFTWGSLIPSRFRVTPQRPQPALAVSGGTSTTNPGASSAADAGDDHENRGSERQNGRRSSRSRPGTTGVEPRPGRRRRNQRG